jgi:2-polyprenyl-6-methoxyphenol hydroxylase-like FAD-dependent oxidoreductase
MTQDDATSSRNSHAIVIGGSIAGLLAARVLVDYFDRVTVVERDSLTPAANAAPAVGEAQRLRDSFASSIPSKPVPRQGVPQSHQLHVLLTQGYRILEQLFPGLKDELADNGTPLINWLADYRLLIGSVWAPRFPYEMSTHACTRNLLEFVIRRRLANYSSVEFKETTQVTGLLANPDNTAVIGIQLRDGNGTEAELSAQLVVDAGGRHSKAPLWLKRLGYEVPQETVVNSFLGYASRMYEFSVDAPLDYKVLYVMPKAPDCPRGSVIYQVEGGCWMVGLIGVGRDYPPTDEAGFLNFAQSLRTPEVYQAIKDAQPLSPIYGYRRTENRWRHYEQLSRFPQNFVVIGDAVCAFNPVYGQGMTVAALDALTLDQCLKQQHHSHQGLIGFSRRFQKQLAKVNSTPWMMATSDDFRWATTQGAAPGFVTRLTHWYLDRVMQLASKRADVYKVFAEVIHLIKQPTALFQLPIMLQVLRLPHRLDSFIFFKNSTKKALSSIE